MSHANLNENNSISAGVAKELLGKILSGELKAGCRLPTEREMAEDLGVSRASVHQAIVKLELQGFVSIVPRHGTVVNDFRKYPTPQSLEALMSSDSLELDRSLFDDMMDTRLWLESECARRACTHIYENTLHEMQEIVNRLTIPDVDLADLIYTFHYKLTQASGNSLYAMIFRGFEPVLRNMIGHHYSVKGEDIIVSVAMHQELLDHIRAKDENAAADCVCAIIRQGINVLEERY